MTFTIRLTPEWVRAVAEHPRRRKGYFLFEPPNQVYSFDYPSYGFSYSRLPGPVPQAFMVAASASLIARLKQAVGSELEVSSSVLRIEHPKRSGEVFEAHTAEHDRHGLLARRGADIKKALALFGTRLGDDILLREIVDRANATVNGLREPFVRPMLIRDLPSERRASLKHLRDDEMVPSDHTSSREKQVQPQATAALLVSGDKVRLGVVADLEARHHLSRIAPLIAGEIAPFDIYDRGFCCLVDPRECADNAADWWIPPSERWAELKRGDHAVSVYEPRMIELTALSGGLGHIWGADRHRASTAG